ncbi:hypothetical protein Cob_v007252 [Colletotrichum orbiculare MAFF 240422]|uniref:Uncharacterized protein n=1 Tax=Colletotrichum orbiculare (strain 104-T / ATCC 96160 / CBS 514.97 / LARS 414 / MAFF 240422) TaxID=1213857 RepID=N4V5S3_COLOR|nr:hypothetical protein Cob_v007252 [Colletotrichum orbiculare MAFF 240422]
MPSHRIPLPKGNTPLHVTRHLQAVTSTSCNRIPLPRPIQPLHVYRHLLRAATYFPLVCRPYLEQRIKFAFRRERERAAAAEKKLSHIPNRRAALGAEQFHRTKALEEGRRKVTSLNAALAGDATRFQRILFHCFGTLGKRRRELFAAFAKKAPEPPSNAQQLEKRITDLERERQKKEKLRKIPPTRRVYDRDDPAPWVNQKLSPIEDNWDLAKLRDLFASQHAHRKRASFASAWPRGDVGQFNPKLNVPKTDIWGRPPAARRVTKKVRQWWKTTAEKLVPPVDESEWQLLRSLAQGDAPRELWKFPLRRPIAAPTYQEDHARNEFHWAAYATVPIRELERPRSRKFARLTGAEDDGPYSQTQNKIRENTPYSNRKLRRMFGEVWQTSSYAAEADSQRKGKPRVTFTWGTALKRLPPATGLQHSIFEGVDSKGNAIGQQS